VRGEGQGAFHDVSTGLADGPLLQQRLSDVVELVKVAKVIVVPAHEVVVNVTDAEAG